MARSEHLAELTRQLETIAAGLSAELGIEAPRCKVRSSRRIAAAVRAGARGRAPLVVVTSRAMERLDPMALRWTVAHELGHVADREGLRRYRRLGRIGLLVSLAALAAILAAPYPAGHLAAFALVLPCSAAGVVQRRRLERAADRTAHRCCAEDPEAGRRALRLRAADG